LVEGVGIGVGAIGAEVATVATADTGTMAGAETEAVTDAGVDVRAPTATSDATGLAATDLRAGRSGVWLTIVHLAPAVRLLT